MGLSDIFGRVVALIGAAAILLRRQDSDSLEPAYGRTPKIPKAKPQGIPTLKMPTAKGWAAEQMPTAAAGLKVNAFAAGLKHPRWIHVLPNGDVLVAEALSEPGGHQIRLRLRHVQHDEARGRRGRKSKSHHAVA